MVVRDLLVGPKRFGELQRGLPNMPSNVLTARLRELETAGLVARRPRELPAGGVVYELTPDGRELEETVVAIGRWGARRLGDPREHEIVTEDSIASALLTTFRPDRAREGERIDYELRAGDILVHALIRDRTIRVGRGPLSNADLTIEAGPALRTLLAREITPEAALSSGIVRIIDGPRELFDRFAELFRI
jgi:DNA-binding HxlR family transcriptional regulator